MPSTTPAGARRGRRALIAGTVGVGLGLSSFGGFAVWQDIEELDPGTITTGAMSLGSDLTATWTDGDGTPIDITSYAIGPGETLTYSETVTPTIVGASGGILSTNVEEVDVAPLTTVHTFTIGGREITAAGIPVTEADNGSPIQVSLDVTLPEDAEAVAQSQEIPLQRIQVALTQGDTALSAPFSPRVGTFYGASDALLLDGQYVYTAPTIRHAASAWGGGMKSVEPITLSTRGVYTGLFRSLGDGSVVRVADTVLPGGAEAIGDADNPIYGYTVPAPGETITITYTLEHVASDLSTVLNTWPTTVTITTLP